MILVINHDAVLALTLHHVTRAASTHLKVGGSIPGKGGSGKIVNTSCVHWECECV